MSKDSREAAESDEVAPLRMALAERPQPIIYNGSKTAMNQKSVTNQNP